MNKKVSVIMSTLNTKQEYLSLAIRSILKQSYDNFELIIVCDGGNDIETIDKFKDSRIKTIIHTKIKGLPFSLNEAISQSTGYYIARMDSDDYSMPNRLELQVKYMENNSDIDICGTYYRYFGDSNKYVINVLNQPEEIKSQLFVKNVIAHPSVMMKKSFLLKNDLFYSIKYSQSQDYELWTRAMLKGKISIAPFVGILYRKHNKQVSSEKKDNQMMLYKSVLERNLKCLNMNKNDLKYIEMINMINPFVSKEVSNFIDRAILANDELKVFNQRIFKNSLYNTFFILVVKNHKLLTNTFSRHFFKIWNLYNLKYILKKIIIFINFKFLCKYNRSDIYE